MADYNEIAFEQELCAHLEAHGWLYSKNDQGYDRERALYADDVYRLARGYPARPSTQRS